MMRRYTSPRLSYLTLSYLDVIAIIKRVPPFIILAGIALLL